jgi:glycosyltransferase involved in cell wall biosynthesis
MKISIVTAVKNASDLLTQTISSIQIQEIGGNLSIEHIIIDGQSNDGSIEVASSYRSFANNTGLSVVLVSESDTGIYDAMDKGRKIATGDFLFFLNAGDQLSSIHTIKTICAQIIEVNNLSSVYYGKTTIHTKYFNWVVPKQPHNVQELVGHKKSYYPHHQSIFYPKIFYSNHGYDVSFLIYGDVDYTIRACKNRDVKYLDIDVCKIWLGGFGTSKLSLSLFKRFYIDDLKLMNSYPEIYTIIDKIKSFINYSTKYLVDNTLGVDTKHMLMGYMKK